MPKKIVRKKRPVRIPKKESEIVGPNKISSPRFTLPKAAVYATQIIRWGIVVVLVFYLAHSYWNRRKDQAPGRAVVTPPVILVPTAVPTVKIEEKQAIPQKPKSIQMSMTLDFNGIKSKSGYVGWSKDGSGNPEIDRNIVGDPLKVADKGFEHGIGTHAPSKIVFALNGRVKRFSCKVGADNGGGESDAVIFSVLADGKRIFKSHIMDPSMKPVPVDVETKGAKELSLQVKYAHGHSEKGWADWLEPKFK